MIKFADNQVKEGDDYFLDYSKRQLSEVEAAQLAAQVTGRVVELVHSESLGRPDLSYSQFDMSEQDSDIIAAEA